MSLKARLTRLEREVEWLKWDGWLRMLELQLALFEKKKEIGDFLADHPEKAAYLASIGVTCVKPTPRPQPSKMEAPPPVPLSMPPAPSKPDAVQPAPPVPKSPPAPRPQPPPAEETYDIPEHMQIRPIRWVPPGERYLHDDPHTPEHEDYDPFAEFDAD
jgi:hypothetical protein